jgi:hypothetical protein
MMTGFSDFKEAEMISLGAACVWRKPFSFASAIPVLERLLVYVSFHAPQSEGQKIVISAAYVFERLSSLVDDPEASKYIL